MNQDNATEHMMRKLLDFDKFCFNKCIQTAEKKFNTKEENCLSIIFFSIYLSNY